MIRNFRRSGQEPDLSLMSQGDNEATSSSRAASRRSPGLVMLQRSNKLRFLWPVIIIATRSKIQARTKFRTALRRMSSGIRPE